MTDLLPPAVGKQESISVSRRFGVFPLKALLKTCIILCTTVFGYAQVSSTRFENMGTEDGLAQASVRAITQDSIGFLWVGTQGGLHRYDGLNFKRFRHDNEDPTSLLDNFIISLQATADNHLWVGTTSGLDYFNPTDQSFTHYTSNAPEERRLIDGSVTQLLLDDKTLWVGTTPGGLIRIDDGKVTARYTSNKTPDLLSGLSAMTRWRGDLLLGTFRGRLLKFAPKKAAFQPFFEEREPWGDVAINAIHVDNEGLIWVCTMGEGAFQIDPVSGSYTQHSSDPLDPNSIGDDTLYALQQTTDGSLWFGGGNNGLSKLFAAGGSFERFGNRSYDPGSLASNQVRCMYQDRGGILWVGTNQGLSKLFLSSENVRHYRNLPDDRNSLSNNQVKALYEDPYDMLWIGTYGGGLNRLDRQQGIFEVFKHDPSDPKSLSHDAVFSIFEDEKGTLWIGTYGGGLNSFDREAEHFKRISIEGKPVSEHILHITQGPQNQLWLSTRLGVVLFNPATQTLQNLGLKPGGPGSVFTRFVHPGENGTWWIGTFSEGLFLYDQEASSFFQYNHDERDSKSLPANNVLCMLRDSSKNYWIGTSSGLARIDSNGQQFTNFGTSKDLPSDMVYGILEDRAARLWLSTNNGISRFDPDLNEVVNFNLRNGLQGREFNAGAYFRNNRDELMFGGINGFNIFHPGNMVLNPHAPRVVITSFRIYNDEVELPTHITLADNVKIDHSDEVISFEFAALDFANPEMNTFDYRMEGLDDSRWIKAGTRNFATFTNLPPGDLTLHIRAANDEGVWSDTSTTLDIHVVPPFYRRLWFYLFITFLILTSLRAWSWNHQRQRVRLNRLISERTRSLEESNRALKETATDLRQTQQKLLDTAHKVGMAEIAADVLHNIGNALNGLMVSANVVDEQLESLKLTKLRRLVTLLEEHQHDLPNFLSQEDRAKMLVEMVRRLTEDLEQGRGNARKEVRELHEHGLQIISILRAQRKYALGEDFFEEVDLRALLEDVLHIQRARLEDLSIKVVRSFDATPSIPAPRSKLLNVFNHIIKNACEAMEVGSSRDQRRLVLNLRMANDSAIRLSIQDSGVGISGENMEWIFSPGFSTKEERGGFGLHHCANALMEIGGSIRVESEGLGTGATFILEIPLKLERKSSGQIV